MYNHHMIRLRNNNSCSQVEDITKHQDRDFYQRVNSLVLTERVSVTDQVRTIGTVVHIFMVWGSLKSESQPEHYDRREGLIQPGNHEVFPPKWGSLFSLDMDHAWDAWLRCGKAFCGSRLEQSLNASKWNPCL